MPESQESSTRADVEARLQGTSEAIRSRLDAIQEEVETTGTTIRDFLRRHPLASVGGSLLAGLLIGWLLGGSKGRRLSRTHRRMLTHYIDAIRDEVRDAVAEGEEVGTAVQDALRNRAPLVVYSEDGASGGFLRQTFDIVFDTALTLFIRDALEGLFEHFGAGEIDAFGEAGEEAAVDEVESSAPFESSAS